MSSSPSNGFEKGDEADETVLGQFSKQRRLDASQTLD